MTRSVLLVSTATRWLGSARMPRILARAGFDVASLRIPMPPCAIAGSVGEALAQAGALGYPVVLKRRFGFAGQGVAVVATPTELAGAVPRLLCPDPLDLGEQREPRLLVQASITGPCQSQALVMHDGEALASFAWRRHVATQPVKGQTSVLRFIASQETRAHSEALCRGPGHQRLLQRPVRRRCAHQHPLSAGDQPPHRHAHAHGRTSRPGPGAGAHARARRRACRG